MYIVLDVAVLQFVGRSVSVFLTSNILFCTVCIFVLDIAAVQLLIAQYRWFL